MCEGCFWSQWHDRDDDVTLVGYLATLDDTTREQIDHLYRLLDENSAGRFCTIDGLHAGVNNDNYDSPSYREGFSQVDGFHGWNEDGDPTVTEACDLWDSMTDDARSIAVAMWDPYPELAYAFQGIPCTDDGNGGLVPLPRITVHEDGTVDGYIAVKSPHDVVPFDGPAPCPEPVEIHIDALVECVTLDLDMFEGYKPGEMLQLEGGTFDSLALKADGTVEIVHEDDDGTDVQLHRLPDGVVNDTPVEEAASSEWAHTAVVASYPSGTDPLAAIRDAMTVFMEKKDGSNALEWWQQVRWWHGGPWGFKRGDWLLPPSETGVLPGLDMTDRDAVYITSNRDDAIMFAARHNRPCLYDVSTLRAEPMEDDVIPLDRTSARILRIQVHRVEQISGLELRRVLYELETTRLEAMNPEEAGDE